MYIRTFVGEGGSLEDTIKDAEEKAQQALSNIGAGELHSVQAQTIVTEYAICHIITITYE